MKSINDMTLIELAAFICSHLEKNGIKSVLSGGACVSVYSQNKYLSYDLDFINLTLLSNQNLKKIMSKIGFHEDNRYYKNNDSIYFVEFPTGPLAVGNEVVKKHVTLKLSTGNLNLLSVTDCLKDRLAAYYYWNDKQSLEQAIMVANNNEYDIAELERWSKVEGELEAFNKIKKLF